MAVQLLKNRTSIVWTFLIAITIVSWQLGTHGSDHKLATILVMSIAFIKVRLVGMYFMELRDAPTPLRMIFEGYCLVVGSAVIIMYLAL
ncbi:MAG: hypothetical protein QOF76_3526 [Solirubrobacteraceae bacterium]|jgi:caa(3)-type oxidase subunit IV|nr:hypothetical protein [Solirubrobacteraceae bacterium]